MFIKTSRKGNVTGGNHRLGRTRSEIETNLTKEWGGAALNEEQIDRCRYIEKTTGTGWVDTQVIEQITK